MSIDATLIAMAMIEAAQNGDLDYVLKCLGSRHVHINAQDIHSGSTALLSAFIHGRQDVVDALISKGADPNIPNICGCTALMYAAHSHLGERRRRRYKDTIINLLNAGANPHLLDRTGTSFYSILQERPELSTDPGVCKALTDYEVRLVKYQKTVARPQSFQNVVAVEHAPATFQEERRDVT